MIIASKTAAQNTFPIFLDNSIIKSVMSNTLPGKIMKINRITFMEPLIQIVLFAVMEEI